MKQSCQEGCAEPIPLHVEQPEMGEVHMAFCPNCGVVERSVAQQIAGKITFALVAAAFGPRTAKNPLGMIACVLGGLALGHYIDQEVSKRCPQCGALLRIAGLLP